MHTPLEDFNMTEFTPVSCEDAPREARIHFPMKGKLPEGVVFFAVRQLAKGENEDELLNREQEISRQLCQDQGWEGCFTIIRTTTFANGFQRTSWIPIRYHKPAVFPTY